MDVSSELLPADAKYFPSFENDRKEMDEVWPVRQVCLPRRSQICTRNGDEQAPDARKEPQGENFKDPDP